MCLSLKITTRGNGIPKFVHRQIPSDVKTIPGTMNEDLSTIDNCIYVDRSEYDTIPIHPSKLTVMQLNIRGLINKQSELIKLMENGSTNKVNIALLCETWLRADSKKFVNLPSFYYTSRERVGKKGGGVGILINKTLKYKPRPDLEVESSSLEHIIVEVKGDKDKILIASFYRAPNTDQSEFLNSYTELLESLKKEWCSLIIGLDHNLDLLKCNSHQKMQKFIEINYTHNLMPCYTKLTRITHKSATLIDNIYFVQANCIPIAETILS